MIYCMHAGGQIDGNIHTNSRDAYDYWYAKGERCFEFDVLQKLDKSYIVSHDILPKYNQYKMWTLDELLRCSKEDMDLLMIDYKNFNYTETYNILQYLETKIDNNELDGSKIYFEVDNVDMLRAAKPYSHKLNIICCVDDPIQMGNSEEMRKWDDDVLVVNLKSYGVRAISYPWIMAMTNMSRFKKLKNAGFIMFSRTRNNLLNEWVERAGVDVNLINEHLTDSQLNSYELQAYKQQYYLQYKDILDNL